MGTYSVAEVIVYPVKACRGISVSSAAISATGFLYDREWMVVNADNGRLIAMARAPKLALVQPSLPAAAFTGDLLPDDAVLEINAPGMIPLKVPLKRSSMTGKAKGGNRGSVVDVVVFTWSGQGVDEGPDAATWWSTYLGCNARFVRFDSGEDHGFAEILTSQIASLWQASLEEVNTHFPNAPLAMNRFRPNIIVHGPSAFEEDKWHTFTITHNYGTTLKFHYVMPRALCKVPTINMEQPDGTGEEPLKTLGTYRSGKHLGLNKGNGKQTYFGSYFVCSSTLNKKSMSHRAVCVAPGDTLDVLEMA
ncbi:unnamed protein product [Sphagnum jensenii]|uniref:MOSC domain-containing protein n=1 Tax=Sphagnum jensenii TaxID=128206 RepID=A0ABP0XD12_9BRYO